jgi:hypothetical protein
VKDEGSNLNAMTIVLKSIMQCELLNLDESFKSTFFGHVFSNACHHVTIVEKVCKNLIFISIKFAQLDLYKCITWPKKLRNGI